MMQKQKIKAKYKHLQIKPDLAEIFIHNAKERNQTFSTYLEDLMNLDTNLGYLSQGTIIDQLFNVLQAVKDGNGKVKKSN